jgi:arylsulfatase A-like enzyme
LIGLAVAAVAVGWGIWYFSIRAGRPGRYIRNVLLISIDTCRADSLGCYGNSPQATPNVDALARDGVLFKSVITPFPMTLPAHCSMLTGTYPETHGVRGNDCRLGDANVTLAKVLRTAGYQTAAFVGGFPLAARFGLNQGFQTYDDQFHKGKDGDEPERKAEEVSRPAMAWLEEHGDQPFFLFLHYYDPHYPYDPPPPFPSTYAGEIAYVDMSIGTVMDKLRSLGLDDNTLVILAGDHGESLGEHGEKEHGFFIYQSTLHVPLIVRVPKGGARGRQVEENASLVDILPTVLGLTGVSIPKQVQGVDLGGCLAAMPRPNEPRLLYSEALWPEMCDCSPLYGVLDGAWKYIQCPKPELYNLSQDAGEKVNLAAKQPQIAHRLRGRLEERRKAMASAAKPQDSASAPLDKDTLRQLESLGYVGSGMDGGGPGSDREDPKDFVAIFERCRKARNLMGKHRYPEAQKELLDVVSLRPRLFLARYWLGEIAIKESRPADAIRQLSTALSILAKSEGAPTSSSREGRSTQAAHCHLSLARALAEDGNPDQAIVEFQSAVRIDPESSEARNDLAWMLATCPAASIRNGAKAVEMAQLVVQGPYSREPSCLDTLAAAYAEARQFPKAVATAEEAVALAKLAGQTSLALEIQSRLELYRAGRPYREAPKKPPTPAGP